MQKHTYIINLYGGPGSGKSTVASALFSALKMRGESCEMVIEFAKELVYDEFKRMLSDQLIVLGEQQNRISRLIGKVDFVITDSPVLISAAYNKEHENKYTVELFDKLCCEAYEKHSNINFFLHRTAKFETAGRIHDEKQSEEVAGNMKYLLNKFSLPYTDIISDINAASSIISVLENLGLIERVETTEEKKQAKKQLKKLNINPSIEQLTFIEISQEAGYF